MGGLTITTMAIAAMPAKTRAFVEHALEHFRPGLEQTRTAPTLGEVATQVSAQTEAQATAATTSVLGVQMLGGGNPNSLHAPWDA